MLIDTHAHLSDSRLVDQKEEIIDNMYLDKLSAIIEVGYNLDVSKMAVELAIQHDKVYAAVGIHPCETERITDKEIEELYNIATNEKTVAIGEIGFDYHYENDKEIQKYNFEAMLDLSERVKKPIILHIRDAFGEIDRYLDRLKKLEVDILFHCYAGSLEWTAQVIKKLGGRAYFAFGGAITFKNFKRDDVVRAIPLDRILIETDCPYMTPEPYRGALNEPKHIVYVLAMMAKIREMDRVELDKITTENAMMFFKIGMADTTAPCRREK